MENALLVGLSRQVALRRELDVVANNMANVSTNGFKSRSSRFETYMMPKARADAFTRADRKLDYVIDSGTTMNTAAGSMDVTRNPLDVAIKGDAFFVVQTPGGERYTRNGAFQVDATGRLVNSDGYAVVGDSGPITFDPSETDLAIAQDGTAASRQQQHGKVRLVRLPSAAALQNEGANTFSASVAPQPAGATSRLEPGTVERSNVSPVLEMSRLIELNRSYASISSMVGRMDELKRTAMSRLADVQGS